MTEISETKNIKQWLEKSISFQDALYDNIKDHLLCVIKKYGFKLRKNEESNGFLQIEAIYGSRWKAFMVGLIPFGKHFPSGKRLLIKANLKNESSCTLNIKITPYMEIFGSEEVGGVTQTFDEKASDEYFGAKVMYLLLADLYHALEIPLPEYLSEFNIKEFAKDTFWGILIYPLDSYNASKNIHIPKEPGPPWCWGGFILPEVWFIWDEIWGVSMLAAIPTVIYFYVSDWGASPLIKYFILFFIFGTRLFLGVTGNRIYYAKYGRWPK